MTLSLNLWKWDRIWSIVFTRKFLTDQLTRSLERLGVESLGLLFVAQSGVLSYLG